jgi:hypothetical protein
LDENLSLRAAEALVALGVSTCRGMPHQYCMGAYMRKRKNDAG